MRLVRIGTIAATIGLALWATTAMAQPKPAGQVAVAAASPQPAADKLKPGLNVSYFYGIINNIKEIPDAPGKPGAPLPALNYNVGFKNVLTSDREDGVQARIDGFIKLDKPGVWKFAVHSNDGVKLQVGGKTIYELPGVHPDTMSDVIEVNVTTPGWHPIHLLYFEKRNTSTLELFWAPPGVADLAIAPESAFAHLPQ